MSQINVAVIFYNEVELVDMNGPIDVFVKANRSNNNRYNIYTVAEKGMPRITEKDVVSICPTYTIYDCPMPDIIVLPGLITDDNEASPAIVKWVKEFGEKVLAHPRKHTYIMSVCVGIYTLAKTGLLNGRKATTHFLNLADNSDGSIQKMYPQISFIQNKRFVADGIFITTGGITSGIDGALHLVEQIDGEKIARQTAGIMVYQRDAPIPPDTILPLKDPGLYGLPS